jgi:hypothetical protein
MARHARLSALGAALVLLAGCGGDGSTSGDDGGDAPREVTGRITTIERTDGRISALDVTSDGKSYRVVVAADIEYGFDLEHLEQHQSQHLPVRCPLEQRGDELVATAIWDA